MTAAATASSTPVIVPRTGLVHRRDRNELLWINKHARGRYTLLLSSTNIKRRIARLAREIAKTARENKINRIHLLIILKGGVFFGCRLAHELFNCGGPKISMNFIIASSYDRNIYSTGHCRIAGKFHHLRAKDVLIVEDICDTGLVLDKLKRKLIRTKAASVRTCVLLDKPGGRRPRLKNLRADFAGFRIPDVFVVGFGLDHAECYRELPFVAAKQNYQTDAQ